MIIRTLCPNLHFKYLQVLYFYTSVVVISYS